MLRLSIPYHISSNIKPFYGFVRSKLNPADDPTRGQPIRGPSRPEADWLRSLKCEQFEAFDNFLEKKNLTVLAMAELPDAAELLPDAEYDCFSSAETKKLRKKRYSRKTATDSTILGDESKIGPKNGSQDNARQIPNRPNSKHLEFEEHCERERFQSEIDLPPHFSRFAGELLKRFPQSQFLYSKKFKSLDEAVRSGPGLLDLFSGARGFSKAFVESCSSWSLCFDIEHDPGEDLLAPELQLDLQSFLAKRPLAGPIS